MSYERHDMLYTDYTWTQRESEIRVQAMETFRPDNGNTVLTMINSLTTNVFDGTILEIIIHEFIPNTVNTVKQTYEWIKEKGELYYKRILRSVAVSKRQ